MKLERTDHGFIWDDMELTCLCEDEKGRVYMRIKRGNQAHQIYVTKSGKVVINKEGQK